jgi:hypothetical protein
MQHSLLEVESHTPVAAQLHLIVAFTKNASRNEWLPKKPPNLVLCPLYRVDATRSEKAHIRIDRWQKILPVRTIAVQAILPAAPGRSYPA